MSTIQRTWQRVAQNNAAVGLVLTVAIVSGLYAFEHVSGLPASMRGSAVYPPVVTGATYIKEETLAPDPTIWDFRERLCLRVMHRFGDDRHMLRRVNERVEGRFGFLCGS